MSADLGFRLRNDLYCVGWGVKLYSLTRRLGLWPGLYADSVCVVQRRCGFTVCGLSRFAFCFRKLLRPSCLQVIHVP